MAPETQRSDTKTQIPVNQDESNGWISPNGTKQETITCINPATNQVIGQVPIAASSTIQEIVHHAQQAQRGWRRLDIKERTRYLMQIRDSLMVHRKELVDLLMQETGKTRPDALAEFIQVMEAITYYSANAQEILAPQRLQLRLLKNKRAYLDHAPVGTVLVVGSWRAPFESTIGPIISALLAGNAAIIKPSEWSPLIAMVAVNTLHSAGLPKNLVQVIPGYTKIAEDLCHLVDAVVCASDIKTGKRLGRIAGERGIPMMLELGSKNAMIVLNDADMERAANGAVWDSFTHSGQSIHNLQRAYVQEEVYDEFVDRVISLAGKLRTGTPDNCDTDIGALTHPDYIEQLDEQIQDALQKGAQIVAGGKRLNLNGGHFYEPTILVNVNDSMRIMFEETLGPILPIMRVRSPAEAIERTNASIYGMSASVWTRSNHIAHEIAHQLDVGSVIINDVCANTLAIESPLGGTKHSGIGRRKGTHEMLFFTSPKTISEDIFNLRRELLWYPYSETLCTAVDKTMVLLYRQGITRKIASLFRAN